MMQSLNESAFDTELTLALADYLLPLADDELILGHRDSEWCGHAPILEEDIAFANLALDEIGHASEWYRLIAELLGKNPDLYPDQLVYQRPPEDFRNIQLVELPNGDWATSMLRQYLFDRAELTRLEKLRLSTHASLAAIAEKIYREELYHHRHTHAWVKRLGLGTEESQLRMQAALELLWPYTQQIFSLQPLEELLFHQGIVPKSEVLLSEWEVNVSNHLKDCNLSTYSKGQLLIDRSTHTGNLKVLVDELQSVNRMDPEATW
jgi:ring-1,2-phenylacetyl-CoA epoxidase subunit PaaC